MKVKLNEVCDIIKGKTTITKAVDGEYPLVVTAEGRRSNNEYQFDCKAVCVPLVSATGHGDASIKRIHYQEGKFALGTILAAVIPKSEKKLNARYLHIYLSYFKDSVIVPLMRGSANVSLTIKSLESAEIELPDIEKQLEIVEMVSLIEQKKKNLDKYLQEQEHIVVNTKKEILQLAVEGKLVPQDQSDEPVSVILNKIKLEKEQLIKGKKIKKQKPLAQITDDEISFDIPDGWEWVRMKEISVFENGDRSTKYPKDADLVSDGIPFFGAKDMQNGMLAFTAELRYISIEKFNELGGGKLVNNDLVCLLRGSVGKTALFQENEKYKTGFINAQMVIVRMINSDILAYLKVYLKTPIFNSILQTKITGTAIRQLPANNLENIVIPLPPLAEQKRIVEKVDSLMQLCDELEKKIEKSKDYSNRLMESILKSSF